MSFFKKSLSFVALVTGLFVATQGLCVKQSQAVLLVTLVAGDRDMIGRATLPAVVLCVFFFPICLLDEKSTPASVTKQDLADNGYTPYEVTMITQDQAELTDILRSRDQQFVVQATDTKATLRAALKKLLPTVSDSYVNFTADMNSIQ